jgi:hypothetical protein
MTFIYLLFWRVQGPSGQQLQPKWEALHDGGGDLWWQDTGKWTRVVLAPSAPPSTSTPAMRQKIAPLPCWPHLTWPQRKANGLLPASSAAHAAPPPPGWTLSLLRGLWSSRARSSRRASATACVPPSWPPMPQCNVDHGMRCQALTAQTTLRHDTLKRVLRRVLHRASPRCLSLPSAGFRASSKGLAHPGRGTASLSVPREAASWLSARSSPPPKSPSFTPSPSTLSLRQGLKQVQRYPVKTSRSGMHMCT